MATAPYEECVRDSTGGRSTRARREAPRWASGFAIRVWFPVLVLVVWYLTSRSSESMYYPPMPDVLDELRLQFLSPNVATTLVPSLVGLSMGFVAALVVGLLLGWWLGNTGWIRRALMPVLDFFRSTPAIALLPIFIAVLGAGQTSEILLISWASIWPVLLATIDGVANVEDGYRSAAAVLRMSAWQRMRMVDLPAAAPRIFAGIHAAISIAIIAMVAIELYSAISGLGYYLAVSQTRFNLTASWAGAVAAGLVGYILSVAALAVDRRWILRWHYEQRGISIS